MRLSQRVVCADSMYTDSCLISSHGNHLKMTFSTLLQDLCNYKYDKLVLKSLHVLRLYYSADSDLFASAVVAQVGQYLEQAQFPGLKKIVRMNLYLPEISLWDKGGLGWLCGVALMTPEVIRYRSAAHVRTWGWTCIVCVKVSLIHLL